MERQYGRGLAALLAATMLAVPGIAGAAPKQCRLGIMAELPVTMEGRRAAVPVTVNGQETRFWLDSGAFFSIMPVAKANELGLRQTLLPPGFRLQGVGGSSTATSTTIRDFGVAGQTLHNIAFVVGGSDSGNGLIGQNFLGLADAEFDLPHGAVRLINPHDCAPGQLAYWAEPGDRVFSVPLEGGNARNNRQFGLTLRINGAEIRAMIDTGAPNSLLSREAAERAGLPLSGPDVVPLHNMGGFGRRVESGWRVPVDSIALGEERILKAHLNVIDGPIMRSVNAPDMLLGADFLLTHRLYVARDSKRILFTYSGGNPFPAPYARRARATPQNPAQNTPLPDDLVALAPVRSDSDEPADAAAFARRGAAALARHDVQAALSDLNEAIRRDPSQAAYYRTRAQAHGFAGQKALAAADRNTALTLEPEDPFLLIQRAYARLNAGDHSGAMADTEAAARIVPATSMQAASVATLFVRLRQPERAVPMLDQVIDAHRQDRALGSLLNQRCWARGLANTGLDKAERDCDDAIRLRPKQAAYRDSRGLVRLRRGNYAGAVADYDAALAINPRLAIALYGRGLARIALGQTQAGDADRAAARRLFPRADDEARAYGLIPNGD